MPGLGRGGQSRLAHRRWRAGAYRGGAAADRRAGRRRSREDHPAGLPVLQPRRAPAPPPARGSGAAATASPRPAPCRAAAAERSASRLPPTPTASRCARTVRSATRSTWENAPAADGDAASTPAWRKGRSARRASPGRSHPAACAGGPPLRRVQDHRSAVVPRVRPLAGGMLALRQAGRHPGRHAPGAAVRRLRGPGSGFLGGLHGLRRRRAPAGRDLPALPAAPPALASS